MPAIESLKDTTSRVNQKWKLNFSASSGTKEAVKTMRRAISLTILFFTVIAVNGLAGQAANPVKEAKALLGAKQYSEALPLLQVSAANGNAEGRALPGSSLSERWGVTQDYKQVRAWFEKAASADDAAANKVRLVSSLNGFGVSWSHRWGEKGDAVASAEAAHNLGRLYANGWGVIADNAQARAWFGKAAAAGDAGAMNNLGYLYMHGFGGAQDYAQARA
jgi:TPR repeat protein